MKAVSIFFFFFFNDTATTEIYTLSLHDALPISRLRRARGRAGRPAAARRQGPGAGRGAQGSAGPRRDRRRRRVSGGRSEEHTSELQSPCNLVCRLLLEKKKIKYIDNFMLTVSHC